MAGPGSIGLEVIGREECLGLLGSSSLARVGVFVDGRVEVLPVNYVLDGEAIVVRTADGSTLARAVPGREVTVEVDRIEDVVAHEGWSVVVRGVGERLREGGDVGRPLRAWADGPRDVWLGIDVRDVSGRRIVHHGGAPPP